tara:strand:+ start:387 stop:1193 length:807 start_codon:yes stop_codon:yes gene_type:complete
MAYVKYLLTLQNRAILIVILILFVLSISVIALPHITEIESNYDLLFESNTLFLVLYIYVVGRKTILSNNKLKYGVWVLILNKCYDVVTEIQFFDNLADSYEFFDTLLEDGFLQISFLLIALGLTEMARKVQESAATDELTGLYNRKKLSSIALEKFDLIYFDLDGLKLINDTKGHAVGDLMLIRFSQALSECLSESEQAFRIGGDEFVVVVEPNSGTAFISKVDSVLKGENIQFSYGIESTTRTQFREALVKTDQAMYEMKNAQRTKR